MKKINLLALVLFSGCLIGCGDSNKTIVVGATPSPHAEILNCDAVKNYIKDNGYTLKVKVYQDYVTPNKALNDSGIFANYFQHIPYLEKEVNEKNYKISAVCTVHNEPLNLYGKEKITDFSNKTISIINDASNVGRAFELLKANEIITSYSIDNFDAQHPNYTTNINVKIECIDSGLLAKKVNEGGYAVIPGNYALTAWNTETATSYKVFGESEEVAYPNIIAVRTDSISDPRTDVLIKALGQPEVKSFIESTYGPTVSYSYKDLRK